MTPLRTAFGLVVVLILALTAPEVNAVDIDVEASASGGSTGNLFSDSTNKKDTFTSSSVELDWFPRSFARVNLAAEYTYYGNFFNLSNLVYGGGLTLIPLPDSSRFSTYFEGNLKKREFRDSGADSTSFNANEITGDEYDGVVGAGYRLNSSLQLRTGLSFKSSQYSIDGVLDRERADITVGANATLFGSLAIDMEMGYSTGKYQFINPEKYYPVIDTVLPRASIDDGEQYSILLIDRLNSFYVSPRIAGPLGRKVGLALTYSRRIFLDRKEDAVIYGYSTGYLSPWLGEYAGQAVILRIKTYLVPGLITSISAGFWEREHLSTVERELRSNQFGQLEPVVNLRYARERTDWRRRVDIKIQLPLRLGKAVKLEPSIQADYSNNNSTVAVYDYDDFTLSGGVTVRF